MKKLIHLLLLIPFLLIGLVGCSSEQQNAYVTELNTITLELSKAIEKVNTLEGQKPIDDQWMKDMEAVVKNINDITNRGLALVAPDEKYNEADKIVKEAMSLMQKGINLYFEGVKEKNIDKQLEGSKIFKSGSEKTEAYANAINEI